MASNGAALIPGDFNPKKLTFGTPKVLVFQTPEMTVPFGLGKWSTSDGKGPEKYHFDLSFKGKESRKVLGQFFEDMQSLDKLLVKSALDNCQSWFKKKYPSEDVVEALYTPIVKFAKDKATGEVTDKYPPTIKINLPYRDGRFDCEVYDKNEQLIDLKNVENELKGAKVSAIIRLLSVWFAGGKFGVSWKVVQMQVTPQTSIKGFAMRKLEETTADDIDDDDEVSEGGESVDPNEVLANADIPRGGDDEDDAPAQKGDLVESSDDELEAPPKPVAAKKVVTKKAAAK